MLSVFIADITIVFLLLQPLRHYRNFGFNWRKKKETRDIAPFSTWRNESNLSASLQIVAVIVSIVIEAQAHRRSHLHEALTAQKHSPKTKGLFSPVLTSGAATQPGNKGPLCLSSSNPVLCHVLSSSVLTRGPRRCQNYAIRKGRYLGFYDHNNSFIAVVVVNVMVCMRVIYAAWRYARIHGCIGKGTRAAGGAAETGGFGSVICRQGIMVFVYFINSLIYFFTDFASYGYMCDTVIYKLCRYKKITR